ncbi:hypothetical protein [Streptomyces sp. NPDC059371]
MAAEDLLIASHGAGAAVDLGDRYWAFAKGIDRACYGGCELSGAVGGVA